MAPLTDKAGAPRKASIKGRPVHGRDIDVSVKVMNEYKTARTRDHLAYVLMGGLTLFVSGATAYGLYHSDFSALRDFWTVAGPFAGAIVGYYFHLGREHQP
jgi:hypothetical protein